ncbi:VOC family protein [Klebsiella pneumoniae]|uniref:VOC family protein n=1 Tax=Klebsiella pneumoniae TaxID=573 RepID=UPI002265EC1F|nr:VOC family protein [Klebsiella pneumoniae]
MAGGRHPGWGTRNALSYFGLTYIEFSPLPTRTNCAPRRTNSPARRRTAAAGE